MRKIIARIRRKKFSLHATLAVLVLLFLVLPLTIFLAKQEQETRQFASTFTPTLERLEDVADDVSNGGSLDYWGPHKSRIIRTSTADIFLTYNTTASTNGFNVMHRSPSDEWTKVYIG